jgi:redox-regulated HSP33 family molecular chaperone
MDCGFCNESYRLEAEDLAKIIESLGDD